MTQKTWTKGEKIKFGAGILCVLLALVSAAGSTGISATTTSALQLVITVTLAALVLGGAVGYLVVAGINRALNAVTEQLDSRGKLTAEVPSRSKSPAEKAPLAAIAPKLPNRKSIFTAPAPGTGELPSTNGRGHSYTASYEFFN